MNEDINKEFTHLKIHTQYSICEGALRTIDLAKFCKVNQIKAVGLCDSNNLCGALEFSESIAKSKTQPIIGTQINIQYKGHNGKIPLFAKNLEGYKNLIKLSSKSFLEINDEDDPHCKIEDLEKNSKGLIMLSGTFDGLIGKLFFKNLTDEIIVLLKRINKIFSNNLENKMNTIMTIINSVTLIVTIASIIAAITPTPKDDIWIADFVLDLLAFLRQSQEVFPTTLSDSASNHLENSFGFCFCDIVLDSGTIRDESAGA